MQVMLLKTQGARWSWKVMETHGILEDHFPGLKSHGKQQRSWKVLAKIMSWNFYSTRNARIASAVLATAIPSVCHTPVLCQNDGT